MYTIAIHGGAGTVDRSTLSLDQEIAVQKGLEEALRAGQQLLEKGENALDAVEAAVRSLENNPLFNAGKGAVFNFEGGHELDAAIMCGQTRKAGAVAAITGIKNPISLARAVMEKSEFVLLSAKGAEEFARLQNLETAEEDYFYTEEQYTKWQQKREEMAARLAKPAGGGFGTVGAVALDASGNLAAATSTGGLTCKQYSRVGDSPIIGGGTYANNETCAVSCTGDGEFFIRLVTAYDVSCMLEYQGLSLAEACNRAIHEKMKQLQGEGGLIAVDRLGNVALPYNSPSMYRGYANSNGAFVTAIFEDENAKQG
jgi:beta-aspartyl-peptidase (threonine type)